jgi:hypothetical protein
MYPYLKRQALSLYNHEDRIFFWSYASVFFMTILLLAGWGIFYQILPDKLPLFYSLPWGETQLVTKTQFVIVPALIVLITLINIIISWHLHHSQLVLKRIIYVTSSFISLLLLITSFKIIFIFI